MAFFVLVFADVGRSDGEFAGEAKNAGGDECRQDLQQRLLLLPELLQAVVDLVEFLRLRQLLLLPARELQEVVFARELGFELLPAARSATTFGVQRQPILTRRHAVVWPTRLRGVPCKQRGGCQRRNRGAARNAFALVRIRHSVLQTWGRNPTNRWSTSN
jgi:hypothetical protein